MTNSVNNKKKPPTSSNSSSEIQKYKRLSDHVYIPPNMSTGMSSKTNITGRYLQLFFKFVAALMIIFLRLYFLITNTFLKLKFCDPKFARRGGGCLRNLEPVISKKCGYFDKKRVQNNYEISGFTEHFSCLTEAKFNFLNIWNHGVKHQLANSILPWTILLFFVLLFFRKKALPYSILLAITSIGLSYFAPVMYSFQIALGFNGVHTFKTAFMLINLEELYKFFMISGFYFVSSKVSALASDTNLLEIATVTGIGFDLQESFMYLKTASRFEINFQLITRLSLMHMWFSRASASYSSSPSLFGLFLSLLFHSINNYVLSQPDLNAYFWEKSQSTKIIVIFTFRLILLVLIPKLLSYLSQRPQKYVLTAIDEHKTTKLLVQNKYKFTKGSTAVSATCGNKKKQLFFIVPFLIYPFLSLFLRLCHFLFSVHE